jgi:hypothetical protein
MGFNETQILWWTKKQLEEQKRTNELLEKLLAAVEKQQSQR